MKELGEYLKETRKNNSVSIDEVSEDLKLDKRILENIENGNSKAFKDILELKDIVKKYAKYLGLDPEKIIDEFNDFLFEHTSKISLSDILEAEKKQEEKKKVMSPYTKIRKSKKNYEDNKFYKYCRYIFLIFLIFILIFLLFKYMFIPKEDNNHNELESSYDMEVFYELS